MTEEELEEFDEATEHHYDCRCEICKKWWESMGEEE